MIASLCIAAAVIAIALDDFPLLTPPPEPAPRINGPSVYGARPGRPFLYRIPCTGVRPIRFEAVDLPKSMKLDPATGIIEGVTPADKGSYVITLSAVNVKGSTRKPLKLMVGDTLALTPPMGWNSWYIHYDRVSEQHMRQAADQMIATGMADFGYQFVNIDDCWMKRKGDQPYRDAQGRLLTNSKFPDIAGMVQYIHSKGLRAGLYTSPGPWTCAGYAGAYLHEQADAKRFADWGFDFLKYDWCSYSQVTHRPALADPDSMPEAKRNDNPTLAQFQEPYKLMGDILRKQDRDIVYNLCQYGMGEVWKWGGDVGGNCWRTTGDLGLERDTELPGFYSIGFSNMVHWENAAPGRWNDPDYILIGWVGAASQMGEGTRTKLTAEEQYSYMSMWCLMAAPLIFSGDMAKLDPFTLNVLCNAEVIEVDQDPLGRQARPLQHDKETLILAKSMADGSLAIGLFNLTRERRVVGADWALLGLKGPQRVRDLWRQKDLSPAEGGLSSSVGPHGVMLLRLWPRKDTP